MFQGEGIAMTTVEKLPIAISLDELRLSFRPMTEEGG